MNSKSRTNPYLFLTLIKKKENEEWEKPSSGEGKTIKISLEEIAMILRVLKKETKSWKGFHSYEGTKTSIELNWTGDDEILVKVDQYSKQVKGGQIDVWRLLWDHILKEKVEFSTELKSSNGSVNGEKETEYIDNEIKSEAPKNSVAVVPKKAVDKSAVKERLSAKEKNNSKKSTPDLIGISGIIVKSTEKALQIRLDSGEEKWLPKSKVHSEYDEKSQDLQLFQIESWLLRNKDE